jgi:hypothetical protein
MGLDMYLHVRKYVSGYSWKEEEQKKEYSQIIEASGLTKFASDHTSSIQVEVVAIYWRKVNAVHNWFVELSGAEDNCQEIPVSRDHLKELRHSCSEVLLDNSKADKLLPPSAGFFFGSTEIDEYYIEDIQRTYDELNRVIGLCESDPESEYDFYYQASW